MGQGFSFRYFHWRDLKITLVVVQVQPLILVGMPRCGVPARTAGGTNRIRPSIFDLNLPFSKRSLSFEPLVQMTAKTYRVQFYEASCLHCKRTFSVPLLGDQSYGQFIFHGERGGVFGYLFAFDEPAWEDITDRLRQTRLYITSQNRADSDRFQRVIAASADPVSGQSLALRPVCPSCHSDNILYGDSKPLEIREIPYVTFNAYQRLSDEQKT